MKEPLSSNDIGVIHWRPLTRVLFRLVSSYLFLYVLVMLSVAYGILAFWTKRPDFEAVETALHSVVPWVGVHILGIRQPMIGGRADVPFDWVLHFILMVCAVASAAVWSVLDWSRPNYRTLDQWLRLVIRLVLAVTMFTYGFIKVFPLQFYWITRYDMVRQVGDLGLGDLMWAFMAASPAYTIFSGCLEVLTGILLLLPQFEDVGALLCVAVMANVFALNLAYNVHVKIYSFNLLLIAIFLAAPQLLRLAKLLIWKRAVPSEVRAPLSNRRAINLGAHIVQGLLGAGAFAIISVAMRHAYANVQKQRDANVPLQGIWKVEQFSVTGDQNQPLFTPKLTKELNLQPGEDRWQKLIFDIPNYVVIQTLNGQMDYVNIVLDKNLQSATMSDSDDKNWKVSLKLQQPLPDRLNLQGEVNGVPVIATLRRMDESSFKVRDHGLHLVQP